MSTAPIRVSDIVLGKFYALATLLFIPVAIISIYPLVLSAFGEISLAETDLAVGAFSFTVLPVLQLENLCPPLRKAR